MNVSDSVAQAVQPVDGKYGQVHDAHAVPESCSFGKWMPVNGHLHCARVYDGHDCKAALRGAVSHWLLGTFRVLLYIHAAHAMTTYAVGLELAWL